MISSVFWDMFEALSRTLNYGTVRDFTNILSQYLTSRCATFLNQSHMGNYFVSYYPTREVTPDFHYLGLFNGLT